MPIIWIGLYARPALDDYSFSASSSFLPNAQWWSDNSEYRQHYFERSVRYAVLNGNILDVGRAVINTVADNYLDWQGTFTAIALFSIHPGVLFGHAAYPLTMLFTIFSLIAATAFIAKTVLGKDWLIPCILSLTASIQFLPHIAQGFFWYNGAVFYVFFFCLMLIGLALKIRFARHESIGAKKWIVVAAIALLDFFIGGGNLVTALLAVQINIIFILLLLLYKSKNWLPQLIFTASSALGLLINFLAPGNAVRHGGAFQGFGHIIWSIGASISTAARDIAAWTTAPVLILLILAVPCMWHAAKKTEFTFKLPLLVVTLSFLIFASQNAPPLYGQSISGPPRLRNIVYFSYIWLLFGNVFYFLGWIKNNYQLSIINYQLKPKLRKTSFAALALFLLGFAMFYGYSASTTWATYNDLRNGLPQQFLIEHNHRQYLLNNQTGSVTLPAYSNPPLSLVPWWDGLEPFLWTELGIGPQFLINRAMSDFYGVDYIYSTPPPRARALPQPTTLSFDGNNAQIGTYFINDNRYLRLRDLAYFLGNVFNVGFENGQFSLLSGQNYSIVGGELRIREYTRQLPAYFFRDYVLIDGIPQYAVSYTIESEIFYRMTDILEILNIDFDIRYGIFYLTERS